jgi:hypothetical protein
MTRTKSTTTTPATSTVNSTPTPDAMATMLAAIANGEDMTVVMAKAKSEQARKDALDKFGILKLRIVRNMGVQTSNNGDMSVLATVITGDGIKTLKQTEEGPAQVPATDVLKAVMKKTSQLQISLLISESFADTLADKRADMGNVEVEVILSSVVEFRSVQGRFDKNDTDVMRRGKPIFLTADGQWTEEDTGNPYKVLRLRATASSALSWQKAASVATPMADLDEILQLAEAADKLQNRSLSNWSQARIQERNAATQQQDSQDEEQANQDLAALTA